jgi:O6-methylguanine-DNA--protein-cysteine methyltransferase
MIQAQIAPNETWNVIVQAVALLASMASLALAIVAIWLSFKFYTMSIRSSEKIEEANRAIGASVDRLEKVFQMQYSDTLSMVRDTYADFRKHVMPETMVAEHAAQLAENNADRRLEQLRTEIKGELTKIVDRVGQTDAQLGSVTSQLEGVVEKAISRSRRVDQEAVRETLKASVISYTESIPFGEKRTVGDVVAHSSPYMPLEVVKILFELSKKGKIEFDREINEWFAIGTFDQVEPSL